MVCGGQRKSEVAAGEVALVVAGLLVSITAGWLICKLPQAQTLSLTALCVTAVWYVSVPALAGGAGAWILWSLLETRLSFSAFALYASVSWLSIAPILLLFRENSMWMAPMTALVSAITVICLRNMFPYNADTPLEDWHTSTSHEKVLFADSLRSDCWEWHALGLSVCIYGALFAIRARFIFAASLLLAICAFVLARQLTSTGNDAEKKNKGGGMVPAVRLASVAMFSVLITVIILFQWIRNRDLTAGTDSLRDHDERLAKSSVSEKKSASADDGMVYQGIILWPFPQRKEVIPPVQRETSVQVGRTVRPLVIPFDGSYWYFQIKDKWPGAKAHVAHGNPIAMNIHSSDFLPLVMEAHQSLGTSIDLTCCSEIRVAIKNGDNRPGHIALGIVLTDSESPGKRSQYLGEQSVISSEPAHFSIKSSPTSEVLKFQVPIHAKIRRFDEITIIVFPDAERSVEGAKINIQEFELLPR